MRPSSSKPIPADVEDRLNSELAAGEKIVWTGQPIPRRMMTQKWGSFCFGAIWTAAIVWFTVEFFFYPAKSPDPVHPALFWLFTSPFYAVGFGMLSSPWWAMRSAAKTVYAITNRRVIAIKTRFRGWSVISFPPDQLTRIERRQHADGSGDLIFEEFQQSHGSGTTTTTRGLIAISKVREVETLLAATLLVNRTRTV